MNLRQHDAPGRYWVESESGGPPYLVDLLAHDCVGECGCKDYEFRVRPAQVKEPNNRFHRCKHISAAREAYLDLVLHRMAELTRQQTSEPDGP